MLRWLRSTLRGEVSITDLEPRRRAGMAAYSLAEEADGLDASDRAAQVFKLCAWNAFALQTIADTLIESDAKHDPSTVGYVPRSTLRYASACVTEVPIWIRGAHVAKNAADPPVTSNLPASLPKWMHDEPTTTGELDGLRTVYEILEARVEAAAAASSLPAAHRMLAEMTSAAEYGEALLRPGLGPVDRGEVRAHLLEAIRRAFELGQVLALPSLADVLEFRTEGRDDAVMPRALNWLDICTGWLVRDDAGGRVGFVQAIRGDRDTGEFAGLNVDAGADRATVHVPAAAVTAVRSGEVVVDRARLGSA